MTILPKREPKKTNNLENIFCFEFSISWSHVQRDSNDTWTDPFVVIMVIVDPAVASVNTLY